MKKLVLTVSVDLPEDEFDRAEVLSKLRGPLDAFKAAVKERGIEHRHETKVLTPKGKKAEGAAQGRRVPRQAAE